MIPNVCIVCELVKMLPIKVADLVVIHVGLMILGYNEFEEIGLIEAAVCTWISSFNKPTLTLLWSNKIQQGEVKKMR